MGRALRDVIVMEWTVSLCLTLLFLPILVNSSASFEYKKPTHKMATLYSFKTADERGTMRQMKETGTLGIPEHLPIHTGYGTGAQEHARGHHDMLQRGSEVYSVLGLLSFATFIFSVLYSRYKMKNSPTNRRPFQGGAPQGPLPAAAPTPAMMSAMTPAPTRNDFMSEENLLQMFKRASKIFSKVVDEDNLGTGYNTTSLFTENPDEADYYDLDFDESQHSESE